MPRYKGIGMPKAKKQKKSKSETPTTTPTDEPDPNLDFNPPSPPPKPPNRLRAPASPGMQAVKAATYKSKVAARTARVARAVAHRSCATYQTYSDRFFRNIRRVQREFEAAAKDPAWTQRRWLCKVQQAELLYQEKLISTLMDVIVAYGHSVEAKNAERD